MDVVPLLFLTERCLGPLRAEIVENVAPVRRSDRLPLLLEGLPMNRRQILLAARTLQGHSSTPSPENQQADLIYLTKLMLEAEKLRWRRREVIRRLAAIEAHLISALRAEHQDRPMARRPQRRLFMKQQKSARRDAGKSVADER